MFGSVEMMTSWLGTPHSLPHHHSSTVSTLAPPLLPLPPVIPHPLLSNIFDINIPFSFSHRQHYLSTPPLHHSSRRAPQRHFFLGLSQPSHITAFQHLPLSSLNPPCPTVTLPLSLPHRTHPLSPACSAVTFVSITSIDGRVQD